VLETNGIIGCHARIEVRGVTEPPSFLIIGAPKAGTSYLFTLLAQYPGLAQPARKELRYFAYDHLYAKGKGWYDAQFQWGDGAHVRGEASPFYAMRGQYPRAAERIVRDLPGAKLIFLVREPVARAISHYRFFAGRGVALPPFERILEDSTWYNEIVDPSSYFRQLEPYLGTFYPDRLLVIPFGLLKSNPSVALRRCTEFLGFEEFEIRIDKARRNQSQLTRRELPSSLRKAAGWLGHRGVSRLLSPRLRWRVRQVLSREVENAPPSAAVLERLRTVLAPDTRQFLELVKGDEHFWNG